jgi:hypothetical protein
MDDWRSPPLYCEHVSCAREIPQKAYRGDDPLKSLLSPHLDQDCIETAQKRGLLNHIPGVHFDEIAGLAQTASRVVFL